MNATDVLTVDVRTGEPDRSAEVTSTQDPSPPPTGDRHFGASLGSLAFRARHLGAGLGWHGTTGTR